MRWGAALPRADPEMKSQRLPFLLSFIFLLLPSRSLAQTTICNAGRYLDGNACRSCPIGQTQPSSSHRDFACIACGQGRYSLDRVSPCIKCPEGKYQEKDVATKYQCFNCQAGYFAPPGGAFECRVCDIGKYQDESVARHNYCYSCGPGEYSPSVVSVCRDCEVGQYQDEYEARDKKCKTCGVATAAPTNKTKCESCSPGRYQDLDSASTFGCLTCVAGQISASNATACVECNKGRFQEEEIATSWLSECKACAPGQASPDPTAACAPCLNGKYQDEPIATLYNCKECFIGQYSPDRDGPCETCTAGKYQDEASSQAYECKLCRRGRYAIDNENKCQRCQNGLYQPIHPASGYGISQCLSCGKGTYAKYYTARQCTVCPAGKIQRESINSRYACTPCPAGFAALNSTALCEQCLDGTYQQHVHAQHYGCKGCGSGMYAPDATTSCSHCPKGRFHDEGILDDYGPHACKVCPSGRATAPDHRSCQPGWESCTVDPAASSLIAIRGHANFTNFTDGLGCVLAGGEDQHCPAPAAHWLECTANRGRMCTARVQRQFIDTGALAGTAYVDICVPTDCVGRMGQAPACTVSNPQSCPSVDQRAIATIERLCVNPAEQCFVSYVCIGKTAACTASTYHALKLTELAQCTCEGCAKVIVQGPPAAGAPEEEEESMMARFQEQKDFQCIKPQEYVDICKDVGGWMCTIRIEFIITSTETGLRASRAGNVHSCLWNECAACYNNRPWEKPTGCDQCEDSLEYMKHNPHLHNELIQMFGWPGFSTVEITKLEYRCPKKPWVDEPAIIGGSIGGAIGLIGIVVGSIFIVKRRIRDTNRQLELLGKSKAQREELLDQWGIGYKARRKKELKKAAKKRKKAAKKLKKLERKRKKRFQRNLKRVEKRAAKQKKKHDKKVAKAEKKRLKQEAKRKKKHGGANSEDAAAVVGAASSTKKSDETIPASPASSAAVAGSAAAPAAATKTSEPAPGPTVIPIAADAAAPAVRADGADAIALDDAIDVVDFAMDEESGSDSGSVASSSSSESSDEE